MPISLDQYRTSNGQFYSVAIRTRHILSLFEYQLIKRLICGGVKFLPCIIILHFLRNDLEQEVTKCMMHNHHGTNVNYTHNILPNMYYMLSVIAILLIISGIELNPGPIENRTFLIRLFLAYQIYISTCKIMFPSYTWMFKVWNPNLI